MSSEIKVLYITNHSEQTIKSKPDNFAYYVKSMMSNKHIDLCLLKPSSFAERRGISNTISIVKAIRRINPDILYLGNLTGLNKLVFFKRIGFIAV